MTGPDPVLVLVVDDEEGVREALTRGLRRLGCDVLRAEDGDVAMRLAVAASPAVIFLDLNMPGIDGHDLLRQFPAAGVDATIIAMSGAGKVDEVIEALRTGAVDYMKKPWTHDELASTLARAVDVSRAVDKLTALDVSARSVNESVRATVTNRTLN